MGRGGERGVTGVVESSGAVSAGRENEDRWGGEGRGG